MPRSITLTNCLVKDKIDHNNLETFKGIDTIIISNRSQVFAVKQHRLSKCIYSIKKAIVSKYIYENDSSVFVLRTQIDLKDHVL